jgi:hypothetical protein
VNVWNIHSQALAESGSDRGRFATALLWLKRHNQIARHLDWSLKSTFRQPIRGARERPLGNRIAGERRHEKRELVRSKSKEA